MKTLAQIATVVTVFIAFLQYIKVEPNALDKIPELYKTAAENDVKAIEMISLESEYSGKNNPLFFQYKAAIAIPGPTSKNAAISKVIRRALQERELKIAIAAAKEMTGETAKSVELKKIVSIALATEGSAGLALMVAELILGQNAKTRALNEIVDYYERKARKGRPPRELTSLEKYKAIYVFADSIGYISLSGEEAKIFTENWLKNRDYKSFLSFKEYFIFADSPAYLSMNSENAVKFAIDWLDKYSPEEFELYKEAFIFSDSPSGMSLSSGEAMDFALNKVMETRAKTTNKPTQPTPKISAADS